MTSRVQRSDDRGDFLLRLDEHAQKAMIFARMATSHFGGTFITPEHILLGVLQATPDVVSKVIAPDWSGEQLEEQLGSLMVSDQAKVGVDVGVQFDSVSVNVMQIALKEAAAPESVTIRVEHLLLALLSQNVPGARLLREAGVTRDAILALLRGR